MQASKVLLCNLRSVEGGNDRKVYDEEVRCFEQSDLMGKYLGGTLARKGDNTKKETSEKTKKDTSENTEKERKTSGLCYVADECLVHCRVVLAWADVIVKNNDDYINGDNPHDKNNSKSNNNANNFAAAETLLHPTSFIFWLVLNTNNTNNVSNNKCDDDTTRVFVIGCPVRDLKLFIDLRHVSVLLRLISTLNRVKNELDHDHFMIGVVHADLFLETTFYFRLPSIQIFTLSNSTKLPTSLSSSSSLPSSSSSSSFSNITTSTPKQDTSELERLHNLYRPPIICHLATTFQKQGSLMRVRCLVHEV